jgi:cytidine diphosphoramidate kinase
MVIWLIGMSCSGKTTLGRKLFNKLSSSQEKWVFLDGDTFRNILGEDLGHSLEDRYKNAYRVSRFCEYLNSQDINVLACILSIFHDNQRYNRENIPDYKEIYLDVTFENLLKRDNKGLYKKALQGETKNVVGVDIEFIPPYEPDIFIDNNSDHPCYDSIIQNILESLNLPLESNYSYTTKDLLELPHKYQYSKYEGQSFLNTFKNDRSATKSVLKKRLHKHIINGAIHRYLTSTRYLQEDTLYLKEFLIFLYLSKSEELKKHTNIINTLVKRFEVGKKLYKTYDSKEIRKSSREYEELINYPLFSLILQRYYQIETNQQKFVYLNAILKVNDIISSVKYDYILYNEIYYAIDALDGELAIMEEYID